MEKREPMYDTLSITEMAKLSGTSRQNIHAQIQDDVIRAKRGEGRRPEWEIPPESLIDYAQSNHSKLIASIGIFLFSRAMHENKLMSDESFEKVKADFKIMINMAKTIDALQTTVEKMINEFPFMREALED